MAEIIKYVEVVENIALLLKGEFNCKVYSDEVLEDFDKPCFFIKVLSSATPMTVNFSKKEITVVLTYFSADENCNELHYLDVFDRINILLQNGLTLKERHLHTDSIVLERTGEALDVIQITVEFGYLERIKLRRPDAEMIEDVELNVKVNEREVLK